MTLRKIWLIVLTAVTIIAITANTVILAFLTDQYFLDYLNDNYNKHLEQIVDYTTSALKSGNTSYSQMALKLEPHLIDPIIGIDLYDTEGNLLANVSLPEDDFEYNMGEHMMGMFDDELEHSSTTNQEVRQVEIKDNDQTIAILNVTIQSIAENSFVARKFKSSLLMNSLMAVVVAIVVAIIIGIIISRIMSKSLKDTEKLATDIQLGKEVRYDNSQILEINTIRKSLWELNTRLKFKQKNRKSLVDQLTHQTRTPLTILQTHLEAIEDGLVDLNQDELEVCLNQINNIEAIISNMSEMIDAGIESDEVKAEDFEISEMLKQIKNGLQTQFDKKKIKLSITTSNKIMLHTDKYKLSQAIYNILTNAYKYTDNNGEVEIKYLVDDKNILISIKDNGKGISEQEQSKIFDAYYRSDVVAETKGDGLGLYIVKQNIEAIGGRIILRSIENKGSTFVLDLPLELK